jgi:hypothetical protein
VTIRRPTGADGRPDRIAPWRLPPIADTDDGNRWATGRCWFWCGRETTRVVWLGPASVHGVTADVFSCAPCAQALADHIIESQMFKDRSPASGFAAVGAPRHTLPPPAGRHRRLP